MRMLVVEFGEIAVDGFGMAAFGFELDRQVLDLEFTGHPIPDRLKEVGREGLVVAVDLDMRGHHDEAWFDRPNMKVMDILHAGDGFDGGCHLGRAQAGRGGLQENLKRFFKERPGPPDNRQDHKQAHKGIEYRPSGEHDNAAAHDHPERHPGIAQHMPKGAADIQIVLRTMLQQEGNGEVRREADQGDEHDPSPRDRDGSHEAFEADERDAPGGKEQDEGIEKRRDDPCPVVAEGAAVGGGAGCQDMRIQRQEQGALIDKVMPRVSNQADAVGEKAAGKFRDDDDGIDRQRDSELGAEFMVGVRNHRIQCLTRGGGGQAVGGSSYS